MKASRAWIGSRPSPFEQPPTPPSGPASTPAMQAPAMQLSELTKNFGSHRAVDDLRLTVRATRCSASSARTAPARRRPCRWRPGCCAPTVAASRSSATTHGATRHARSRSSVSCPTACAPRPPQRPRTAASHRPAARRRRHRRRPPQRPTARRARPRRGRRQDRRRLFRRHDEEDRPRLRAHPRPARLGARQLEQTLPELLAKINT